MKTIFIIKLGHFHLLREKKFKTSHACGALRCIFISLFYFYSILLFFFFSEDGFIVFHLRVVIENKINFKMDLETGIKHLQKSRMSRLRFN